MAKICTKPGGKVHLVTKKGKVLGEYVKKTEAEAKAALTGGRIVTATKTINWNCGRPTKK